MGEWMDGGFPQIEPRRGGGMTGEAVRRSLSIEDALRWAYRDELPKRESVGSMGPSSGANLADYGTSVEHWDREPGYPSAMGAPHPDAETIDAAVQSLPSVAMDAAAARYDLAPEFAACIDPEDRQLRAFYLDARAFVIRHARMGTLPQWKAEGWEIARRIGRNGKVLILDADDGGRYGRCPLELLPDPREMLTDRAEYVGWRDSLNTLAQKLAGKLSSLMVLPPASPRMPWITGDAPAPRILPDLSRRWLTPDKPKRATRKGTWA